MITIDRIEQGRGYWYHFPTIDFKFQNRGLATAFLWQFVIEIVHAEIDRTPLLDFESDVDAGVLLIHATNNGWGDADNCQIQLEQPVLNLLFSDTVRQYKGTLQSGKKQDIFRLSTSMVDAKQFETVKEQFQDPSLRLDYYGYSRPVLMLRLKTADLSWQCDGSQHKGQAKVDFEIPYVQAIILTEFGFEKVDIPPPLFYPMESDTTYGAIIDPSLGSHEQKYPISRKISSGDVERFHIMVGSPMSCHLQVRFKFFVDLTTIIESNLFDINIWNPKNSQWHLEYTDNKNQAEKWFSYPISEKLVRQRDASIFPLTSTQYPTISQTSPLDTGEGPKSPREASTEDRDRPSPSEQVSTPALVDHSQEIYPPVEPRHLELIRNMKRFFKARFK